MPEIAFKCPKCGHSSYEEIQAEITVSTACHIIEDEHGLDLRYGNATNCDGYVDRYQCCGCGYTIIDHNSPLCEEGLDENALAAALKALPEKPETNPETPLKKGDPVTFSDLIHRIADAYEGLEGSELATLWNELFPSDPVVYEGDSLFWVVE